MHPLIAQRASHPEFPGDTDPAWVVLLRNAKTNEQNAKSALNPLDKSGASIDVHKAPAFFISEWLEVLLTGYRYILHWLEHSVSRKLAGSARNEQPAAE